MQAVWVLSSSKKENNVKQTSLWFLFFDAFQTESSNRIQMHEKQNMWITTALNQTNRENKTINSKKNWLNFLTGIIHIKKSTKNCF